MKSQLQSQWPALTGALSDLLFPVLCFSCGQLVAGNPLSVLPKKLAGERPLCSLCLNSVFRPVFSSTTFLSGLNLSIPSWAVNFYHSYSRQIVLSLKYGPSELSQPIAWELGYYHGLGLAPRWGRDKEMMSGLPIIVVPAPSEIKKSYLFRKLNEHRLPPSDSNQLVKAFSQGLVAGLNFQLSGLFGDQMPFQLVPLLRFSTWGRTGGSQRKTLAKQQKRDLLALAPRGKSWEKKHSVILVDDVITTGATVKAMVKAVEETGWAVVGIFSLLIAKENPGSAVR